jgi:CubicO group peptidase (beta-lactamase class C family)
MHIGSITKVFTTTLVMQLVDDGLISLDQPVEELLPELRLRDSGAARSVTVRMLLNHTSGIDADVLPDAGPDNERVEDAIRRFADAGQLFAPGSDCSYCNPGMVIAGYLAQRLRQRSWHDLVRERLYAPLAMNEAVTQPAEALLRRASVGHHTDPCTGRPVRTSFAFLPASYAPAGSTLMMSARDLAIFVRTHLQGGLAPNRVRILSAAGAALMRRPTAAFWGMGRDRGVGLGWCLRDQGAVGHTGGGPGIAACAVGDPRSGFVGVVLTNAAQGNAAIRDVLGPIAAELAELDLFPTAEAVSFKATPGTFDPSPFIGEYQSNVLDLQVRAAEEGLLVHVRPRFKIYDYEPVAPIWPVIPLGGNRFALRDAPEAGQVAAFSASDGAHRCRYLALDNRLYPRVSSHA